METTTSNRVVFAAATVLLLASFATLATAAERAKPGDTTTAVPANFRQLVARALTVNSSHGPILAAEISQPSGGDNPFVCAKFTAQGPFIQQDYIEGFRFTKGQISQRFNPMEVGMGGAFGALLTNSLTCGSLKYSTFKEVVTKTK